MADSECCVSRAAWRVLFDICLADCCFGILYGACPPPYVIG